MNAPKKPFAALVRELLILGLLTLAPLVLTLWVFVAIVRYLDSAIYSVLSLSFYIPGLGALTAFLLVLLAGSLARTYFGRFLNTLFDGLFVRVPVVRSLYSSVKQISAVFFSADAGATFQRVVLVPFPHANTRAIAFLTGAYSPTQSTVYVPTAPNPTSGYVVIYDNDQIEDAHMEVDEAFKIIVSCGFIGKQVSKS